MNDHDALHRWNHTWIGSERLLARGVARPVARFLRIEAAGGVLLLVGALVAVVWANSPWSDSYVHLWETVFELRLGGFSLEMDLREWVNDGAMALFFFVVGMEIKREMVSGDLQDPKAAALPIIAAAGGMLVPALIFLACNLGGPGSGGWGIPMATDIAFAVGVVSLLGPTVPVQLKLFLLTLAVADDLGAIFVIAIAYSQGMEPLWLAGATAAFVAVVALKRARVWFVPVYVVIGVVAWYCMLRSGVHATVAGVVLGFLTPTRPLRAEVPGDELASRLAPGSDVGPSAVRDATFHIKESVPIDVRLVDLLHPWTGYVIIPIFALANAGVPLDADALSRATTSTVTLGVFLGLVVGKTVGVMAASTLAVRAGVARLPQGSTPLQLLGAALAAGIGFTVAIFVTGISLDDAALQDEAKIGIFAASFVAALASVLVFRVAARRARPEAGLEVPGEPAGAPAATPVPG